MGMQEYRREITSIESSSSHALEWEKLEVKEQKNQ
jgi:hypothetical protein